jgi:hypothetical protein
VHITLNDEVAEESIRFLMMVLQQLGDENVRGPIRRAIDLYSDLQRPMPPRPASPCSIPATT